MWLFKQNINIKNANKVHKLSKIYLVKIIYGNGRIVQQISAK